MLKDTFNRAHNYLRISLTDVCNFRCQYCMPEDNHFLPPSHLMNVEEIEKIANTFVRLGITKIRLTGGEPLVRKDAKEIIMNLSKLPVELTMTTNGVLIDKYIDVIQAADMRSINVSIDSLKPERFFQITRRNAFHPVWANVMKLIEIGIHVKLNVVVMKSINDDEVLDFVRLTKKYPLHVRFIEFMPFDGNRWQHEKVVPYQTLLNKIETTFSVLKLKDELYDTTKKYKVLNSEGTFAFITTMSQPFCSGCNRLRLTADGKMKNCLFSTSETDLLTPLRNNKLIEDIITQNVLAKKKQTGGQLLTMYEQIEVDKLINRPMVNIGG